MSIFRDCLVAPLLTMTGGDGDCVAAPSLRSGLRLAMTGGVHPEGLTGGEVDKKEIASSRLNRDEAMTGREGLDLYQTWC